MLKLGADDPELQSEVIENVYQVKRLESTAGDLLDKFASETANLENAHEVKQYLRLDQSSSEAGFNTIKVFAMVTTSCVWRHGSFLIVATTCV